MISIGIIMTILSVHWFADFFCQTDWMAKNKSTNVDALCMHVGVYSMLWILPAIIMFQGSDLRAAGLFVLVTLITHFMIDSLTSKLNTYLWNKKEVTLFLRIRRIRSTLTLHSTILDLLMACVMISPIRRIVQKGKAIQNIIRYCIEQWGLVKGRRTALSYLRQYPLKSSEIKYWIKWRSEK